MNNEITEENLDFCRIKKIFDKGFGFLTSLYHQENVFFHFSKIKDEQMRKSLLELKRGVISVFFTSTISNGQRKVEKVWLNIAEVPEDLLPNFIERLILELNDGVTNPFEIIGALNQLKQIGKLSTQNLENIISSKKIVKNPSILNKLLTIDEQKEFLVPNLKGYVKI